MLKIAMSSCSGDGLLLVEKSGRQIARKHHVGTGLDKITLTMAVGQSELTKECVHN